MKRRPTPSAILGVLSIFAIGAAAGIFVDRTLHRHGASAVHAAALHEQALSQLRDRLDLEDGQLHSIDSVLRLHQGTVDRTWETLQPQVHAAIDSVHIRIESLLRPDQREAFRTWVEEQSPDVEMHLRRP